MLITKSQKRLLEFEYRHNQRGITYSSSGWLINPRYPLQQGQYNSMACVRISSSCFISVPLPSHLHFGQLISWDKSTDGGYTLCMLDSFAVSFCNNISYEFIKKNTHK